MQDQERVRASLGGMPVEANALEERQGCTSENLAGT